MTRVEWSGCEVGRCFGEIGRLIEGAPDRNVLSSRLVLLVNELLMCVLDLLRMENPPRQASLTTGERSVAMLLERVRQEPGALWTLESMAGQAGLARTRFAHHCLRLTNLTPMAFLQHARVAWAKQILLDAKLSIKDVAADGGFGSSEYFAYVFGRHAGCTPREWRQGRGSR